PMRDDPIQRGGPVMEHRDPPRIVAGKCRLEADGSDPGGRFHLPRFDPARRGRPRDYHRAILLTTATTAALLGAAYCGTRAVQTAIAWLQVQSPYQIPFNRIGVESNEPGRTLPDGYRGDRQTFLESVRRDSRESETLPLLHLEPDRVKNAFVR